MRNEIAGLMIALGGCFVACGGNGGTGSPGGNAGDSNGGAGAVGVGGTGSSGDTGTGATGAGGTTGSGGAGQANGGSGGTGASGAYCSGTLLQDPTDTYAAGNVSVCYGYAASDGGIPIDDNTGVRNIKLPAPMIPGQEYSMSIQINAHDVLQGALWGSSSDCGFGSELLWSGRMSKGVFCTTLHPTKASTRLLLVWGLGGGQHGSIALCPGVACPN